MASFLKERISFGIDEFYDFDAETDHIEYRTSTHSKGRWRRTLPKVQVKSLYFVTVEVRVVRKPATVGKFQLPFKERFDVEVVFFGIYKYSTYTLNIENQMELEGVIRVNVPSMYNYSIHDDVIVAFVINGSTYTTLADFDIRKFNATNTKTVSVTVRKRRDEEVVPLKDEPRVSPSMRRVALMFNVQVYDVDDQMVDEYCARERADAIKANQKEAYISETRELKNEILRLTKESKDFDLAQKKLDRGWVALPPGGQGQQQQQGPGAVSSAALTAVGGEDIEAAAQLLVDSGVFL
jgi:hypothetical protein